MSATQCPFPVRRVVTVHSSAGTSSVIADTDKLNAVYDLHYTGEAPAAIDAEIKTLVSPDGSSFRCWDLAPGEVSVGAWLNRQANAGLQPMHRTVTIDYVIVFKGTVTLELEEGKVVTLKEGDTTIQRGTMHRWRNASSEWVKVYYVMLGAKPIQTDGKILEQEFRA
ncbi:hypothetical protein C8R43DRAFT_1089211 [Mycena crocata]|nr:hypothetical protein C8R43DRAFT_1089211 [Mycena crocata]